MVEAGKEYNPETAQSLRPRAFAFHAFDEEFRVTLEIPEYILARLNSETLDRLQDYMDGHAAKVIIEAMRGGYLHTISGRYTMRRDVAEHLKNYIWERFSISQEAAGNDCWQVAPSLQKVHIQ